LNRLLLFCYMLFCRCLVWRLQSNINSYTKYPNIFQIYHFYFEYIQTKSFHVPLAYNQNQFSPPQTKHTLNIKYCQIAATRLYNTSAYLSNRIWTNYYFQHRRIESYEKNNLHQGKPLSEYCMHRYQDFEYWVPVPVPMPVQGKQQEFQ